MNKNFISVFLLMLAMGVSVMAQSYEEDLAFFKERVKTLGSDEFGGRKPLTEYETKTIHRAFRAFHRDLILYRTGKSRYFLHRLEITIAISRLKT